jgi:hypothetical protein
MDFAASSVWRRLRRCRYPAWRAGAHHHADLRTRELDLAVGTRQSTLDQHLGALAVHDDHIRVLAARKARRNRLG